MDITIADGGIAWAWRTVVLAAALAGLAAAWRRPALYPWLFLLATKAVAAVAFFGYARLGATAIPVVALLVALAIERWWPARTERRRERAVLLALGVMVAIEAVRCLHQPGLALDGDAAGPQDPVPTADHRDHALRFDRSNEKSRARSPGPEADQVIGAPRREPPYDARPYRPYSVRPNVTARKTPICSRLTLAVGQ